jgi:MoxR-like ATPase
MNDKAQRLKNSMQQRIVGKGQVIDRVIIAILSGGHLLLEDVPGVGKTTLAKALSDSLSLSFSRIQCTPDTTPSDITGVSIFSPDKSGFQVIPGPIVNNIVLADELNRTSPKTQSALLEVMEEHCVTIDGNQIPVPEPFMVIGTQNPAEMAGTYPLPEAQLDRFMMKLSVGYPDVQASEDMARRFLDGSLHQETQPVLCGKDILDMRGEVEKVTIHENLRAYAVLIADATRNKAEISCGASPRALLTMLRCAQAIAYLDDRDYCIPEDIAEAAKLTLPHRLILTTEARLSRVTKEELVKKILEQVKVL